MNHIIIERKNKNKSFDNRKNNNCSFNLSGNKNNNEDNGKISVISSGEINRENKKYIKYVDFLKVFYEINLSLILLYFFNFILLYQ